MSRVVVVTGASYGVGRAIAASFARRGDRIGLLARTQESLGAAREEVEQLGGQALAVATDVARAEQVEAAATAIEEQLGPIDVWVNNAMATIFSPFRDLSAEEYRRATEVTYLGTVHGTMSALRRMRPRNRGTIVQVGSALAYRAIPLQSAYCGAKFAIRGFTDSVRCELLHDHSAVHLTMVQLPALNTPQFEVARTHLPSHPQPVPPIFEPEVAAEAVVFAAEARRREIWVGWPTMKAILGTMVAPGFADLYLARTGVESQQTDEPVDPDRPDNLFEPVPGRRGAHGRFDEQASTKSLQLELSKRRDWLPAALGGLLAAFALTRR